jgi:flagellar basal-body rod protein FlgG
MIDALYISATGLRSQQAQIDVISNNVANLQTPGFKASRVSFGEITNAVADVTDPTQEQTTGDGSIVVSTLPVFSEGSLQQTQNLTDLAIQGNGFFELENAQGEKVYTRSGQLRINSDGNLTSVDGLKLSQNIQIPPDANQLQISATGQITALLGTATTPTTIGTIELATFAAPDALQASGGNNWAPTEASGAASLGKPGDAGFGTLLQGSLESSNVDLVAEMSNLMVAQRAYQLNARILQASDQILDTINNLRR